MRLMQVSIGGLILGIAAMGCSNRAAAQTPPPMINQVGSDGAASANALRPDSSVDDVLDALHNRGQDLKEFVADVALTDVDTVMGSTTKRIGKVWFQSRPDGDARLHVRFDRKSIEDKPPMQEEKEYLLDGGWLVDRDYRAKVEVRRQVSRPGEKVNLFQLGKGPFPLPIGQERKSVHDMFEVTKAPPAKDDPPGSIHLQLAPKPGTDLERKFATIDVWVDPATRMPVRIQTLDREKTTQRQTDFANLKVNPSPGLKDDDFALPSIENQGWSRHDEPYAQ